MVGTLKDKLQPLFTETLSKLNILNKGYDDTNDVYLVTTIKGKEYILKVLKNTDINRKPFWQGLNLLFKKTLEDSICNQKRISDFLNQFQIILVPDIVQAEPTGNNPLQKPYVIMNKVEGQPVLQDSEEAKEIAGNKDIAYQLGRFLSKAHAQSFDYFGNMSKEGLALKEFPKKFAETLKKLALSRKAQQDPKVQQLLPHFMSLANALPPPISAGIIMLDLWPTQFLLGKNALAALIDIEGYVIGPIALELTLLELWLGNLDKFKEGYLAEGADWPDFEEQRELYRFFLYLLYDCPEMGLEACLYSEAKFAQGDRIKNRIIAARPRPDGYPSPYGPGL